MIRLKKVQEGDRGLLWNVLQKYLYEMTRYYPEAMDSHGNYPYRFFDAYFSEPERAAYLIYSDDDLAGFAMINPYSYLEQQVDHVLAEFSVFPAFRGRRLAMAAAQKLLDAHPGLWEIKFNEKNAAAKRLWEGLAAPYEPTVHHFDEDDETVLAFSNRT